jgi:nucleoid-associated protein YgaU
VAGEEVLLPKAGNWGHNHSIETGHVPPVNVKHDTCECESMPLSTRIPGPPKKGGRTLLLGVAGVLLAGLVCAVGVRAQDAQDPAEAARAEKARKAEQAKTPRHVYTEDDLKRAQILTPEDQAKVAARKNNPTEKKEEQAKSGDGNVPAEESLGEVARRYRREKAEWEAARLMEQGKSPQFPMKLPETTMAAPRPSVQPKMETRPMGNSRRGAGAGRVSPFEPRPLRSTPREVAVPSAPKIAIAPREPKVEAPVAKAVPVAPVAGMVARRVVRGDSWWKLAENYLGSGARWKKLREMNPAGTDARPAEFLLLGSTVLVPAGVVGRQAAARIVTVKKGDTLWSMAREHFGHGAAWKCLAEANPELGEPEQLQIGARVRLPAGNACAGEVVKSRK